MGKEEQIKYWIETSAEDWKNVRSLLKDKRNLAALFFAHLSLEKILKAHWTKTNETIPPKIHDLIYLHDQTDLELTVPDLELLSIANNWNIEGRYPDFKKSLYKIATDAYTKDKLEQAEKIWKLLREKLE